MATKNRIIHLMRYLFEHSDDLKSVTTAEIRQEMARLGCPVIISTLRDDIASLREAGYEIEAHESEGLSTTYSWLSRELDPPELQILVDAVSSSQFITVKKSRDLIEKLIRLAGPSYVDALVPRFLVSEHVKAPNEQILISIQEIRDAITRDRKINFQYMTYVSEKERVPRHKGTPDETYTVSPYATVWNNDRYYLVGWSDKRQEVNTYRVDRMARVRTSKKKRVPEPEGFNVQDYTDKVFWMYDGSEEEVTLRCRRHLMDQVVDKFGEGVSFTNLTEQTFDVTVPVSVSGTFFAWVFQFVGEMVIASPERVRDAYAERLQLAIDDALA